MTDHSSHSSFQSVLIMALGTMAILLTLANCQWTWPDTDAAAAIATLQTISPGKAATLTAWPTPGPLTTRRPTLTPAPQSLWTAETPVASETPSGPSTPPVVAAGRAGSSTTTPVRITPVAGPLGTRPPAVRLAIPVLGLDAPVVEISWEPVFEAGVWKSEWQTADRAVGHHRNSANPGEIGNIVMSAHHNTAGEIFREVAEIGQPSARLGLGDEILLFSQDGLSFAYRIVTWDRVLEESASDAQRGQNATYLNQTTEPALTLITCWPYEGRSHRVVVVAKPAR